MPPKNQIKNHQNEESDTKSDVSSEEKLKTGNSRNLSNSNTSIGVRLRKRKERIQESQQQDNWRNHLSSTAKNSLSTHQNSSKLSKKYPKQIKNKKREDISVIKNQNQQKLNYQNLCSICLANYSKISGVLKCGHKFCFECLEEWTKTSTKCPCCRQKFSSIVKITLNNKNLEEKREIIEVEEKVMDFNELDYYICEQCNQGDDEDVLLICDACQFHCCHVYCDPSLNNTFPTTDWFCKRCKQQLGLNEQESNSASEIQIYSSEQQDQPQTLSSRTRAQKLFGNYRQSFPKNRLSSVIDKIVTNSSINLRNIRRKRY